MTGVCLFVCVVGPGFDSTSPAFMKSRASQAAGSDGRLAQKTESGPISGGRDCVYTICADVCCSPTSCRFCLLGPPLISSAVASYTIWKEYDGFTIVRKSFLDF